MSKQPASSIGDSYPEGDNLRNFVDRRNRGGLIWRLVFQASTIIAIIALLSLLYNIIIGSFGYVAVQNTIDPASLVLGAEEERMLTASNTVSSENDNELVEGIAAEPNAIGFFGYAYYQDSRGRIAHGGDGGAWRVSAGPTTFYLQRAGYPRR
jgi:hypothetical protein